MKANITSFFAIFGAAVAGQLAVAEVTEFQVTFAGPFLAASLWTLWQAYKENKKENSLQ